MLIFFKTYVSNERETGDGGGGAEHGGQRSVDDLKDDQGVEEDEDGGGEDDAVGGELAEAGHVHGDAHRLLGVGVNAQLVPVNVIVGVAPRQLEDVLHLGVHVLRQLRRRDRRRPGALHQAVGAIPVGA